MAVRAAAAAERALTGWQDAYKSHRAKAQQHKRKAEGEGDERRQRAQIEVAAKACKHGGHSTRAECCPGGAC